MMETYNSLKWNFKILICILLNSLIYSHAWNLASFNENHSFNVIHDNHDYVIVHVSVFYMRSFICIRNKNNSTNQITFIESTWPENLIPVRARIFPNDLSHAKSLSDCNGVISATASAIDRNGFLWLIDNGSTYCPPKLIIYNLLKRNEEFHRHIFSEFKGGSFHAIHIYHKLSPQTATELNNEAESSDDISCRGLITLKNANFLILFSLKTKKWHKLHFDHTKLIQVQDVTIRNDEQLLVLDRDNILWSGNLWKLKFLRKFSSFNLFISVYKLGPLLGKALALTTNINPIGESFADYLYYYIPRDGAVVRWNFQKLLAAEGHEVLYLSSNSVVQIIFGAKGAVWIVQEHQNEFGDHCARIVNNSPKSKTQYIL